VRGHARAQAPPESPPFHLHPPGHPLSLPDGWLTCPEVGELCFDLFVPCKVPLGRRFNEALPERHRFTPAHALAAAAASPRGARERHVLAVIDLTKTKRYYSPDELRDSGVAYVKLPCSGSEGAPSALEVNTFCLEVVSLLSRWRPRQDSPAAQPVVLVHCTHGFNRTGAMLVHYAMRMLSPPLKWPDLPAALAEFARCRPPGIYKETYIACAYSRA
jgi:mRNA-capping enzyme